MNQKDLAKTFMMISNNKKPFGFHNFHKNISALRVKEHWVQVLCWMGSAVTR